MKFLRTTALMLAMLVSGNTLASHHIPVTRCVGMEHTAQGMIWNVRIDIEHNQLHLNKARYALELYKITNKGFAMYTPTQAGRYYAVINEHDNIFLAKFAINPDAPLWAVKLVCHKEGK